jgi:hypothetical protein
MTWEHWVQSFPTIYKLSRWLESYAELFLDLDRQDGRYDLDVVLRPRADSMLQGGGIDAPPLGLGIGACFVVRELLRLRHINNGFAHEHAFVPTKRLRDMLNHIGLEKRPTLRDHSFMASRTAVDQWRTRGSVCFVNMLILR